MQYYITKTKKQKQSNYYFILPYLILERKHYIIITKAKLSSKLSRFSKLHIILCSATALSLLGLAILFCVEDNFIIISRAFFCT